MDHCLMYWHGPGGMLELTPLINESITGAYLEHVRGKLDELSERGWKLKEMVATQGKFLYVLQRKATGPRLPTPPPGKPPKKDKKEAKKKKKDKADTKKDKMEPEK